MKLRTIALAIILAFPTTGLLTNAAAQSSAESRIEQLEKALKAMQEEIQKLKQEQKDQKNTIEANQKEAVSAGDISGSFRVPGSDTSIKVYGFAELAGWRDNKSVPGFGDFSSAVSGQPLEGTPGGERKGNTKLTARTSRLGVEASAPTQYGPLSAKVEFDFATVESAADEIGRQAYTNSYRPRLRHAYGQFGPFLFGQTWSTFMDVDTLPETLDFNGVNASPFIRQPMFRYTYATQNAGSFSFAIENPDSLVYSTPGGITDNFDRRPDFIARWDMSRDWGSFNVRLLSTEFRIDDGAGLKASRGGWGVGLGAFVKMWGDDFLTLQYTNGRGLGRYMVSIDGAGFDAANNRILLEEAWGLLGGYQHKFDATLRANLVYAYQRTKQNDYVNEFAGLGNNRRLDQAHANLIWTPIKNVDLGIEYLWGQRKTFDGHKGQMDRLMGSAKFNF